MSHPGNRPALDLDVREFRTCGSTTAHKLGEIKMTILAAQGDFADFNADPSTKDLPGSGLIEQASNGLAMEHLLQSVASLLIGGALWGLGQLGCNPQSAQKGRQHCNWWHRRCSDRRCFCVAR